MNPTTELMCPRCYQAPPRVPLSGRGRVPLCRSCYLEASRRQWQLRTGRVQTGRAHRDDIPAAEIERRYQAALAEIRRQRWDARS